MLLMGGCAHSPKRTTPELDKLEGKKVALVGVDGEPTGRAVVEVALINELVKRGTFEIVSKQDVDTARVAPNQDPTDWRGIARRAGADYALRAKVLQFDADTHEGYSTVKERDSQLAQEDGEENAETERLYKVKSLEGHIRVELQFAGVSADSDPDTKTGVAEAQDKVVVEGKTEAAHLPPKLRFLEGLCGVGFKKFFDQYSK